jgi:glycosyltransferase involved in cell wall biosynthesis
VSPEIALFLPGLDGGGAERVTLLLAEGFAARGLQVDLVLATRYGRFLDQVPARVRLVDLGAWEPTPKLLALARYLRQERPAALLSALDYVNIAGCARRLAGVRTRVVLGVHNTVSVDLTGSPVVVGSSGRRGAIRRFLLRAFYRYADDIVAVSQGVADDLIAFTGLAPSRVRVIYNPVVTRDLYTLAQQEIDHPWLLDHRVPVVLAVGRLTTQKDFATLVHAFAVARRECPCRLVFLGDGEERSRLEALAQDLGVADEVAFLGFVQNPYAWMSRSHVLALSSRWEGLPTVLIEALALGTPVIATDCPSGPREILADGEFGTLVPVGDVGALGQAIGGTLRAPGDRARLRRRAEAFTLDRAVDNYLDALMSSQAPRGSFAHSPGSNW